MFFRFSMPCCLQLRQGSVGGANLRQGSCCARLVTGMVTALSLIDIYICATAMFSSDPSSFSIVLTRLKTVLGDFGSALKPYCV